ncbi:MAG: NAD(P)H-hydrate dehydratase [Spirochaetaceae bacterium]
MNLVTSSEMTEIDRRAQEEFGIPGLLLMENAGQRALSIWSAERDTSDPGTRVWRRGAGTRLVFAVGTGNNGGDALVMARQAAIERLGEVVVVPVDGTLKGHAAMHLDVVRRLGISVLPWDGTRADAEAAIRNADVLFDGLAGTGIRGGLRPPLSDIVAAMNGSAAPIVAVDVPSGLSDDFLAGAPMAEAELTLTMGLPKRCLYLPDARPSCGRIRRVAVGFPPALTESDELPGRLVDAGDAAQRIVPLAPDDYKHRRGVCAVFAGARGTTGAAVLAATAAARSTAGMVRVFADADAYPVIASQCRSVMVVERQDTAPDPAGHSALLVGPGWGRGPERRTDLLHLIETGIPGVLDADGINVLADMRGEGGELPAFGGVWVLTPHAGELARLSGRGGREVLADAFTVTIETARQLDAVVCLKSHVTIIASPDGQYAVVDGMNPAMGTGGAGDVLAGMIAGLLARGGSAFDAAVAGCSIHDALGKRLFDERGFYLAEDLLDELSRETARYLA